MASSTPPFSIHKDYYDMSTYMGRLYYFFGIINPMLMFETEASLRPHIDRINLAKANKLPNGQYTDKELWHSRHLVDSCVQATGDVIFPLFRMAAFAPVNYLIVPFMMLPSTIHSVPRTVFIHWFNQSYNALVNYGNRASDAQPVSEILKGYGTAVSVSVSGALGATFILRRMARKAAAAGKGSSSSGGGGGFGATVVRAVLPMAAVAASSSANVALMRTEEWMGRGVQIRDAKDDRDVGHSRMAGQIALAECASARVLWNMPSMMLPPLLVHPLTRLIPPLAKHEALTELVLIAVALAVGVPPALAVFPPEETVSVKKLEDQFQHLKSKNGEPVEYVKFFKGL